MYLGLVFNFMFGFNILYVNFVDGFYIEILFFFCRLGFVSRFYLLFGPVFEFFLSSMVEFCI